MAYGPAFRHTHEQYCTGKIPRNDDGKQDSMYKKWYDTVMAANEKERRCRINGIVLKFGAKFNYDPTQTGDDNENQ